MWNIINAFPLLLYLHQTRFSDSGQWVKGFKLWHFPLVANTYTQMEKLHEMIWCTLIFTFLQWKQQGWLYCIVLNTSGWLWVDRKCAINSFINNINSCIYIGQHHQLSHYSDGEKLSINCSLLEKSIGFQRKITTNVVKIDTLRAVNVMLLIL